MGQIEVRFYEEKEAVDLVFSVIIARYRGKYLWVKHRERTTYEIPGGHIEEGESSELAARRELEEETGAKKYEIKALGIYSVSRRTHENQMGEERFGALFYAEIEELGPINSEIEKYELFDRIPNELTYPDIQPKMIDFFEEKYF